MHLIDMQKQIALFVSYHLCCDIIRKYIAPVLNGMQKAIIIDGLSVLATVGFFDERSGIARLRIRDLTTSLFLPNLHSA